MTTKLYGITLDCPDPAKLAEFYQKLAGLAVAYSSETYVGLAGEGGLAIGFQKVQDEFRAPDWPGQSVPQQLHLDFTVDDLDKAEAEATALGATRASHQADPERWRVMLDPAGHPFCLAKM